MFKQNIIIWYGLKVDCINLGTFHSVQMGCHPDSGFQIQDTLCGIFMVMLNLVKVKTSYNFNASANGNSLT